jgi:hypothetical protein
MIQDDSVSMPNRRTTAMDNAERVHSELINQAVARQAYEQQHANISTRRERMYLIYNIKINFVFFYLAETLRLEEQPLAEDQQALLAEFERRRRVRKTKRFCRK